MRKTTLSNVAAAKEDALSETVYVFDLSSTADTVETTLKFLLISRRKLAAADEAALRFFATCLTIETTAVERALNV